MNLLFTICARAGSKGVKNKNVKDFLGVPLPYYTLSAIDLYVKAHCNVWDNITIAVNTDSEMLIELLDKSKLSYRHVERKECLATDTASKLDVIRDTFRECEKAAGIKYDVTVDLDLTSPLRCLNDIEDSIGELRDNPECDVVFTITDSRRNPYFNMVKEENGYYKRVIDSNYTSRQQAPPIYDMNASIYCYSRAFMDRADGMNFWGCKAKAVKMIDTAVLDIDTEEDYELMQVLANYFYKTNLNFRIVKENINEVL